MKISDEIPRESEEHLRRFIEYAPVAVAMFDRNMRYVAVSRRWMTNFNLGERSILGLCHYEVFPDIPERWKQVHRRCLAGAVENSDEDSFVRSDGSCEWFRWEIRPWHNDLNEIGGIIIFSEPITARKRAEEALRLSEQTARERQQEIENYYRNAPVGLCVLDCELHYLRINQQLATMNGISVEGHLGRTIREVLPQFADLAESIMQRIRATRQPVLEVEFEGETATEPGVHRYWQNSWFPMLDASGNVTGANVMVEEVTGRKRLEKALRASEERFRTAALSAEIGIWSWIPETNSFTVGADWRRLFGVPEIVAVAFETWCNAVHPEDRERAILERNTACRNHTDLSIEYRALLPDGSVRWMAERGRASYDERGRVAGMAGVNFDITDRKRIEEVLGRHQLLAEQSRDIVLYMRRDDGHILDVNVAGVNAYGYTREELCSLSVSDLRAPGTLPATPAQMTAADETGILFETIHKRKDGSVFPVEVSSRGATVHGVRTLISVVRDITQRKRAEETARQWQHAFEQTELGIALAAPGDETFLAVNEAFARQRGYTPQELAGQPIAMIYPPEERSRAIAQVNATDLGTGHSVFESVNQRKDGTCFPVLVDLTVVRGADNRVVSRVAFVHDLTERKQAEERLRQTQKLESVALLAGGVAHDFNNLLTGVMGYASLLLDQVSDEAAETVQSIISGAERASHLTRQLLAYSGKGQFYVKDLDLSQGIRELSDLIQLSIPKNVDLRLNLQERLPSVSMDPGQFQQVMLNLVINAAEAIGEGRSGSVVISTRLRRVETAFVDEIGVELAAGRYVCVEVQDNGRGVDEGTRKKIFDPFFTTKFTGRGLGLAAAAGIMRSQNGGIILESEPGGGSTFALLFPVSGAGRDQAVQPAKGAWLGTILVVEEEDSVRDFLRMALRRQGYQVVAAPDGKEALALCRESLDRMDAVVLDVVTPAMVGDEFLRIVRERRPKLPVLLTSAFSEAEARRYCDCSAGAAFIQKPFSVQQLSEKLGDLLGSRD